MLPIDTTHTELISDLIYQGINTASQISGRDPLLNGISNNILGAIITAAFGFVIRAIERRRLKKKLQNETEK